MHCMGDPENFCPPLFDLLELEVDSEDPSLLNSHIQPLPPIEPPDECTRIPPTTNHCEAPLHTFPDPLPMQQQHYMHEEVAHRPEDQLPVWLFDHYCEPSYLQHQYPSSEPQLCPTQHPEETEARLNAVAPQSIVESTYSSYYFQPIHPCLPATSPIASPLAVSAPPTPTEYSPWTLPALFTAPSSLPLPTSPSALNSPFSSLGSSTESGPDALLSSSTPLYSPTPLSSPAIGSPTPLSSPYTSTIESEPEFCEPELGIFAEPAPDMDSVPDLDPALQHAFGASYLPNLEHTLTAHESPAQYNLHSEPGKHPYLPYGPTYLAPYPASDQLEWASHHALFTCENTASYDDPYYLGDCEGMADTYSNLMRNMDGESVNSIYSGHADEDPLIHSNMEEYTNTQTAEYIPRADIHQVLEELNALKPSLQSIPARTKRDYEQYHNTLAKLVGENSVVGHTGMRREDFSRMLGMSQLSVPTKATALGRCPARGPASHARVRAELCVPNIDVAKFLNRKAKRSLEMESKNLLDTFIKGSKVIRLTHSYQQVTVKPDPVPKKRKTKKEVIEHIHKQIPEFSSLPPPAPKTTPKKPSKDFWKTLETF
eukprot:Phypoly_transcript_04856.p1 GENE.Phypoly_transcript_04856~~Phypoly_transcript_04856.p1  ORF type:complete len:598 (+),score=126.26 Phypoly_transcript_04856:142-1935(+)